MLSIMKRPHRRKPTAQLRTLKELRVLLGLSQQDLASAMSSSQPGVLKAENAVDPQLSTLRRYIEGIGAATGTTASFEVVAIIGHERFPIDTPTGPPEMNTEPLTNTATGSTAATVWRLRAWDDHALEERFQSESVIAMSADEIGDVTNWPSDAQLRRRLRAGTIGRGEQAIGMFVRYWDDFRNQMKVGDIVVVPLLGRRAAIGVIDGGYTYRPDEADPRMRHTRNMRWIRTTERAELPDDVRKVVNAPGTICRIKAGGAATSLLG